MAKQKQEENKEISPVGVQQPAEQEDTSSKVSKLKSKSDVSSFTKEVSRLVGEGATVTLDMPVQQYNEFVGNASKIVEDNEYQSFTTTADGTTIQENGVTVRIRPSFA